jgi:hypothetical protein
MHLAINAGFARALHDAGAQLFTLTRLKLVGERPIPT